MLEMLSAVFGFFAPFATEVFKYFQRKQDNSHELAVMTLQSQIKAQEHVYKMDEIGAVIDGEEVKLIHQPMSSFGVQLLDAAKGHNMNAYALYPAFYIFVVLDFLSGLVRPAVTYAAFAFYASVKWAQLSVALAEKSNWQQAVLTVWSGSDMSIVILVLSYWFGQRAVKAAFGGSAMTSYRGQ
jgi:hypothetical protein